MKTDIYLLDISLPGMAEEEKEQYLKQIAGGLSETRQEKIRQLRFLNDRLCSAGAGLLLDLGLRTFGLRENQVRIAYCGNRKPYLPDYPQIHFNLSHSGTMVMAVFADREAGCDIEKIRPTDFKVADRFFHEEERQRLNQWDEGDPDGKTELFYRYWTMKESFLKVTGEGIRLAMDRFCVRPETGELVFDGQAADVGLWEQKVSGYRAAACVKDGVGEVFYSFQNLQDVV